MQSQRPPKEIIDELKRYIERNIGANKHTQLSLAQAAEVSQATISRILSNQWKNVSPSVKKLCNYAKIQLSSSRLIDPSTNVDLMSAVGAVWDGTPEHAKQLARVIRELRRLRC